MVGRPNAGKSTLVNALVGEKVSIVTPVPQTTRNRILGIVSRPDAHVVLMDTPGIHKPLSRLNERMMTFVRQALQERDLAVLIVDAHEKFGRGDEFTLELLKEYAPKTILALNKIDLIKKPRLLPIIDRYSKLHNFGMLIEQLAMPMHLAMSSPVRLQIHDFGFNCDTIADENRLDEFPRVHVQ